MYERDVPFDKRNEKIYNATSNKGLFYLALHSSDPDDKTNEHFIDYKKFHFLDQIVYYEDEVTIESIKKYMEEKKFNTLAYTKQLIETLKGIVQQCRELAE